MLALNNIKQKDLEDNEDKIIKYFNKVENYRKIKNKEIFLNLKKHFIKN